VRVAAVVLAHRRRAVLAETLARLDREPVDEVLVADNDSQDGTAEMVRAWGGKVRLVHEGENSGVAGRNVAARATDAELLLMLDDDSWPLGDAVEQLRRRFVEDPRLGVLGGFVVDVDDAGAEVRATEVGTFDWFLRAGRPGEPDAGLPAFFFPEGACMVRREAYLEVGGCFEPYWLTMTELDLATRMLAAGWDVRYLPQAAFAHLKAESGRAPVRTLHLRTRNQLWYFWLRHPPSRALVRAPCYLAFDLVECAYRGALGAWTSAVRDAWRLRDAVRPHRAPVPREVARRAELGRGRLHVRLLLTMLGRRLARAGR
jgi:GT2 family glycosyltransferase